MESLMFMFVSNIALSVMSTTTRGGQPIGRPHTVQLAFSE